LTAALAVTWRGPAETVPDGAAQPAAAEVELAATAYGAGVQAAAVVAGRTHEVDAELVQV